VYAQKLSRYVGSKWFLTNALKHSTNLKDNNFKDGTEIHLGVKGLGRGIARACLARYMVSCKY
jgi:hypothetical protein